MEGALQEWKVLKELTVNRRGTELLSVTPNKTAQGNRCLQWTPKPRATGSQRTGVQSGRVPIRKQLSAET